MNNLLIINGTTRGLGLAIVKLLVVNKDFKLVCLVRDTNKLSELSLFKNDVEIYKCDYSSTSDALNSIEFFRRIFKNNFNNIFFINNISTINPVGCLGNIENEQIVESININITSNLIILNNIVHNAIKNKAPAYLLNISSGISINPLPGLSLYGVGKSFLDYITKNLSLENMSRNIRVATFYPGGIDTDMQKTLVTNLKNREDLKEFSYEKVYAQKLFSAEKIAEIICNNFIINHNGWDKLTSNIYDFIKQNKSER
jgi:benzil reductase ((S)-benzoin forming)